MENESLQLARACAASMYSSDCASQALGIDVEMLEAGVASARMVVRSDMVNGHDICHGGLIFTLADTAFAFACNSYDVVTVAAAASVEFLRPALIGDELTATARETHKGKRTGIYDVEVHSGDGRRIALFRGRSSSLDKPLLSDGGAV